MAQNREARFEQKRNRPLCLTKQQVVKYCIGQNYGESLTLSNRADR